MDWLTNSLTHSHSLLERSSFLSNSSLAMQETPSILWNLKVHYHVHQSVTFPNPQPDESTPQSPIQFFNINFYIIFPCICRSSHVYVGHPCALFPWGFPTKILCIILLIYMCHMPPNPLLHTAWCGHIMLGEYKSGSTSLCGFLQSLCCFCPLQPKYLPQHHILEHTHLLFFP